MAVAWQREQLRRDGQWLHAPRGRRLFRQAAPGDGCFRPMIGRSVSPSKKSSEPSVRSTGQNSSHAAAESIAAVSSGQTYSIRPASMEHRDGGCRTCRIETIGAASLNTIDFRFPKRPTDQRAGFKNSVRKRPGCPRRSLGIDDGSYARWY